MSTVPAVADTDLASLAVDINESHRSCLECSRNAIGYAVEAGELLLKAKPLVGHGGFEGWIRKFTKLSPRTARVYMQVAQRWPELAKAKRQSAADLTIRDFLAELASTSKKLAALPPPAVDKVLAGARTGSLKKAVGDAVAAAKTAARYESHPRGVVIVGKEAQLSPPVIEGKAEEVAPPRRHQLLTAHILHAVRTYISEIDSDLSAGDACEALNEAYIQIQDRGDAVLRPAPVERRASIGPSELLVITPSTVIGHSHISIINTSTNEVVGTKRPVRDDAVVDYAAQMRGGGQPLTDLHFAAEPCDLAEHNPWFGEVRP